MEFLQKLQEICPGIPVIVISGYKAYDYMNQAIEHGVVGYLLKPFSKEELEKTAPEGGSPVRAAEEHCKKCGKRW